MIWGFLREGGREASSGPLVGGAAEEDYSIVCHVESA